MLGWNLKGKIAKENARSSTAFILRALQHASTKSGGFLRKKRMPFRMHHVKSMQNRPSVDIVILMFKENIFKENNLKRINTKDF
jgi:hypothetical protein